MILGPRQMMSPAVGGIAQSVRSCIPSGGDSWVTGSDGFHVSGLGSMPTSATVTAWFKYASYPTVGLSRVAFMYGKFNTGCAFGTIKMGNTWYQWAPLIEAKYWASLKSTSAIPTDHDLHHVAMRIKSGTSPLTDAVFIDGVLMQPLSGTGGTASMNSPSGRFSICGRENGSDYEQGNSDVRATRVCIYSGLLTQDEVLADMASNTAPTASNLTHFWDGTVENSKVMDHVGNWDLAFSDGCSISEDTPWV